MVIYFRMGNTVCPLSWDREDSASPIEASGTQRLKVLWERLRQKFPFASKNISLKTTAIAIMMARL